MLNPAELTDQLLILLKPTYPNIQIIVNDNLDGSRQITFVEKEFRDLFPKQRYHKLLHIIPKEFYESHLQDTNWYEIAPGEDIQYNSLDDETIDEIKDIILDILQNKTRFLELLDKSFSDGTFQCHGDFRYSKQILTELGISAQDQFDIFEVIMNQGGFCDCEILLNVFPNSQFSKNYWTKNNKNN